MKRLFRTADTYRRRRTRMRDGFTLVELIVVLIILAILAAAGIFVAVGYIDRSKFDQNSQDAITIYQTAQAVLSQKMSNGTLDGWVKGIDGVKSSAVFTEEEITDLETGAKDDQSINKRVSLTFNPDTSANPEDKYLYDLLSGYFYDLSIFSGTISLELDVTATYGEGQVNYSAKVLSAFYSKQNNNPDGGWDELCIGRAAGYNGYSLEFPDLPYAKGDDGYKYRRTKSLVGWFNGTAESVSGVSPVFLPQSKINLLEGHIVAGTETGYLFNLRNGETLDVAWAVFDKDGTARENHNENIVITLKSAGGGVPSLEALYGNDTSDAMFKDGIRLVITPDNLSAFLSSVDGKPAWVKTEYVTGIRPENGFAITRTTREGFINVDVTCGGTSLGTYAFPISVTEVTGDGRIGTSRDPEGDLASYYEFRLSVDAMMERDDEISTNVSKHFSIDRLTGYETNDGLTRTIPRNIYATLSGTWNYYDESGAANSHTVTEGDPTLAARAVDDPVYQTEISTNGKLVYNYSVVEGRGAYDGEDSFEGSLTITGRCVVNTLFGDLNYGNFVGQLVSGTEWGATGGNAVITSYRHLYNIRKINQNKVATFRIAKDIDWYIHKTVVINGVVTDLYDSEVRVFTCKSTNRAYSPVDSGALKIVSFPAFAKLYAGHTLTSVSDASAKAYSINNVQLRNASFIKNSDQGYALICQNLGTVSNIYTNNLNLVLADVPNGRESDYKGGNAVASSICPDGGIALNQTQNIKLSDYPVGGLIGSNNGLVGNPDTTVGDDFNTVQMKNSIVLAGEYWNHGKYNYGTGIVIGKNMGLSADSSAYGVIEVRGTFAVSGYVYTGGVIGWNNNADIDARLIVDGFADGTSEFTLPRQANMDTNMTCCVTGMKSTGGVIGYIEKSKFGTGSLNEDNLFTPAEVKRNENGSLSFNDRGDNEFNIFVNLPSDSLIYQSNNITEFGIGGAIGYLRECDGQYLSIRISNAGNVILTTNTWNFCGGVIGWDKMTSTERIFIDAQNLEGSRIGSLSDTQNCPTHVGGVFGSVEDPANNRVIAVNVSNSGTIVSTTQGKDQGTGGVFGGLGNKVKTQFLLNVVNEDTSKLIVNQAGNGRKYGGAGGAIGGVNWEDGNSSWNPDNMLFVENHGTISGRCFIGGAIGASYKNMAGRIDVINDGASITAIQDNIGGAIGYTGNGDTGDCRLTGTINVINKNGTLIEGAQYVGGAVGRMSSIDYDYSSRQAGNINVINDNASISGTFTSSHAGGAVGYMYTNNGSIIVENRNETIIRGAQYLSGAVASVNTNNGYWIDGVLNKAEIIVITTDSSILGTNKNVGGAVGIFRSNDGNSGHIESTLSNSTITGTEDVGGAIGHATKNNNSGTGNEGEIIANNKAGSLISGTTYVGGVMGSMGNNTENNGNITANNNTGVTITASGNYVGGVAGNAYKNNGIVTAYNDSATIKGNQYTGGVFGAVANANNDNNGTIRAYNTNASFSGTDNNMGGLIGYTKSGNNGTLYVENTESTFTGKGNIGGLIGCIDNTVRIGGTVQVVNSSLEVNATADNIGGAVGSMGKPVSTIGTQSFIITNSDSVLKSIGSSVGGVIGWARNIEVNLTVTNDNTLIQAQSNAGGVIGCFEANSNTFWSSLTANNKNGTTITTDGNCAAGVAGWLKNTYGGTFTANNENTTIRAGGDNAGGVIGKPDTPTGHQFDAVANNTAANIEAGNTNAGGCIGFCGFLDYNQDITANNTDTTIKANNLVGGAIGSVGNDNTDGSANNGQIIANNSGSHITGTNTGDSHVGGAVGRVYRNKRLISATNDSTTIEGYQNIGGVVGTINGELYRDASVVGKSSNNSAINGTNYVGGAVGESNYTNNGTITSEVVNSTISGSDNFVGGAVGAFTGNNIVNNNIITASLSGSTVKGKSYVGGAVGDLRQNNFESSTWLTGKITAALEDTSVVKADSNYCGGAVGNIYINYGDIDSTISNSSVTGADFVGGAVGRETNYNEGFITATLQGGTVSGGSFIGGSVGAMQLFSCFGEMTTTVKGGVTSTVTGTGSFIGGVVGDANRWNYTNNPVDHTSNRDASKHHGQNGTLHDCDVTDTNGVARLEGDSDDNTRLDVKSTGSGTSGVGGAIGILRSREKSVIGTVYMPAQNSDNRLIVCVDGADYVGGGIGWIRPSNAGGVNTAEELLNSEINNQRIVLGIEVTLRPESHVAGTGSNVGGAIGAVETLPSFLTKEIIVKTVSGSPLSDSGVRGYSNVGGAVGAFINCAPHYYDQYPDLPPNVFTVDFSAAPYNVTAVSDNVGGAVGYMYGNLVRRDIDGDASSTAGATIPPFTVNLGSSSVRSTAGSNVGGAIGNSQIRNTNPSDANRPIFGEVFTVTVGGTISGINNVGGAIGFNTSQVGNLTVNVDETSGMISGYRAIGTAIGYTKDNSAINFAVTGESRISGTTYVNEYEDYIGYKGDLILVSIAGATVQVEELADYTYTGEEITPSVTVMIQGDDGQTELEQGRDYIVIYENNIDAGTATIKIIGIGNYDGTLVETFEIVGIDISGAAVVITGDYSYTGNAITPSVADITVMLEDGTVLNPGDYTLAFADNVNAGEAEVTVTGKANYNGSASGTFTIAPVSLTDAQVVLNQAEYDYTGDVITPDITVSSGGRTLSSDDYVLTYDPDNIKPGSVTVTVTAGESGNYTGTAAATASFTIKGVTVTFDPDGGSAVAVQHVVSGGTITTPEDPSKDGYLFDGWYQGETKFDFTTPVTEDITLTAKWVAAHSVTFVLYEDNTDPLPPVADGSLVTRPEDPSRDGYNFIGWYSDEAFTTEYNFDDPVTQDVIIYAKWDEINNTDGGNDDGNG
ncbi:MAG: InlB B-repeat-containing protein [Saccharofermentans sp.]|nr:InlB B-repeat-containing protein [Saccharofermentans sp.]